ncbi:outer membrane protein transport protein [Spongiibacter taiwanensis]|uniref:OmpP1/FadL family transporter n=1 Tax=Spongiibacter taiwanensis TaxID=1748242 RepID=UPI002035A7B4|nr:outer membrane protein transport protein [Spongiibacter taiwanensis]USA42637.1 outer membrane protein transport protein [Spongiibacter taiwanensis]
MKKYCIGLFAALTAPLCHAANGIYLTGYGATSTGLGGADISHVAGGNALIANPAGLGNISRHRQDYTLSAFSIDRITHKDEFNKSTRLANENGVILGWGGGWRVDNALVIGAAVNVAGGLGFVYNGLNTPFGNRDNLASLFSLFKFSLGGSWNVSERLRVGLAVATNYASAEQDFYANTSVANQDQAFFGIKVRNLDGWGGDIKLGLQYQINDDLLFGINYTSESHIDLNGGHLQVNYEAINLGRVTYNDAKMGGLELPQELGAGLAWTARPDLRLHLEANWFDWHRATGGLTLTASNPDGPVPAGAENLRQRSTLTMRSEVVYSVGIGKSLPGNKVIRAGYSYHDLVLERNSLSPSFALVPQHDLSIGFGTPLRQGLRFDIAFAYQPRTSESYNNPGLPFGRSTAVNESFSIHITLSQH